MQTVTEERQSQPVAAQRQAPVSTGETERLRLPLSGGRGVRLLFAGPMPTQSDIDKLIALLELSKDSFPKSNDDGPQ